jgi:hypothetical protein
MKIGMVKPLFGDVEKTLLSVCAALFCGLFFIDKEDIWPRRVILSRTRAGG